MTIPYQYHSRIKTSSSKSNSVTKYVADFSILRNKPFWIEDKQHHKEQYVRTNGLCCWNHLVSLPVKDKKMHPLYNYESLLFNQLFSINGDFKDKHLWVLKSTGLGITEWSLRVIAWLCTRDDSMKDSQVCIVTGPNISLAITLIDRLKGLFYKLGIVFSDKETVLELNGCRIEAFPSHHLDAMRGLANVKFILLDEADFFPVGQQKDARDISERYIAKSNPYIVLTSTPNKPDSLFYTIEREKEEECIYKRIKLDYSHGLGKIYTQQEIDKQRQSPSFKREYCLQFLGTQGNIFTPLQIDNCINLGLEFSTDKIPVSLYSLKSVGVDFGFSSSSTAIVTLEHIKTDRDIIRVVDCELIDKGDPNSIVDLCWNVWQCSNYMNTAYWIDGSNRAMVNLLKIRWQESLSWESNESFDDTTRIRPVNFNTEHKSMLSNLHAVVSKGYLAIDPKYDKLLISLRTAYANELALDKEATPYNDLLDALRLALKGFEFK
jgi:hypothetical protein